MYFKIEKGTKLYEVIDAINQKANLARIAAKKIVAEVGAKKYVTPNGNWGGGVDGFLFEQCPEGWKPVYKSDFENAFFPKKISKNKDLLERIAALPVIDPQEIADALKYRPQAVGRNFSFHPAVIFRDNVILIDALVEDYKPIKGMIEITEGEHKRLSNLKRKLK